MIKIFRLGVIGKINVLVAGLVVSMIGLSLNSQLGHRSLMASVSIDDQLTRQVQQLSESWNTALTAYQQAAHIAAQVMAGTEPVETLAQPTERFEASWDAFQSSVNGDWQLAADHWQGSLGEEATLLTRLSALQQQIANVETPWTELKAQRQAKSSFKARRLERPLLRAWETIDANVAITQQELANVLQVRRQQLLERQSRQMETSWIVIALVVVAAAMVTFLVLRRIMQETGAVSEHLNEAAAELQEDTHSRIADAKLQQERLDELTTAMGQIGVASTQVTQNAVESLNQVKNSTTAVGEGERIVRETVAQIESLASETEESVKAIQSLEKQTESIHQILSVIQEIAEQTNLLALNAAIEAARAGEQGRGFSVVADEVRSLSQRTQQSTKEVEQMLSRLQQGASQAAASVDNSYQHSRQCVGVAETAGEALARITTAVNDIREHATQTSAAAEEQHAIIDTVQVNMQEVAKVAEGHSGQAQAMQERAVELAGLSHKLKKILTFFRL